MVVAMSLPLLALRASDLSAALPATTIKIVIVFEFKKSSVNMMVPGYEKFLPPLQAAARRLYQWCYESLNMGNMSNAVGDSQVNKTWGMTREQFTNAIALYTCLNVNTPTKGVVDGKPVPYIVSRFEQNLTDDDGSQVVSMEFAVYENILAEWTESA